MPPLPENATPAELAALEGVRKMADERMRELAKRSPSIADSLALMLAPEEADEWDAVEEQLMPGWRARVEAAEAKREAEIQALQEAWPNLGGRAFMLHRALGEMSGLADDVAKLMGWEPGEEAYAKAKEITACILEGDYRKMYEHGPNFGLGAAYKRLVDLQEMLREGDWLISALMDVCRISRDILRDSAEKHRAIEAKAAAVSGWEWLEPVKEYALSRFAEDKARNPKVSRTASIKAMLADVRIRYDEAGAKHCRKLTPDDANAFRTIESWFKDRGIK